MSQRKRLSVRFFAAVLAAIYCATNCVFADLSPAFLPAPLPLASVVRSLPVAFGSVRRVSSPVKNSTGRVVIHIQDVHLNAEAQRNIGQAILQLVERKQTGAVALEGAFGPVDVQSLRALPRRDALHAVADFLLEKNAVSGAVHAALTSDVSPPALIGVDDAVHYEANIAAYKTSAALVPLYKHRLDAALAALAREKASVFNPRLAAFDARVHAYRAGKISLGAHAAFLAAKRPDVSSNLRAFLEARDAEAALNVPAVEAERTRLVANLAAKLHPEDAAGLARFTVSFRLGSIRSSDFYKELERLCERHGVKLARYPLLRAYIRTVSLCESIDGSALYAELDRLEETVAAELAVTSTEKELVAASKKLHLISKLLDFSLTPEEWSDYLRDEPGPRPISVPGRRVDLRSFEAFYEEAGARDEAIAKNVIAAFDKTRASAITLVTGGFHSPGVDRRLNEAGIATIAFVPKISKVDSLAGSASLSVFAQAKTPLDQLFNGEKLFVAPNPARLAAVPALHGLVMKAVESGQPFLRVSSRVPGGKLIGDVAILPKLKILTLAVVPGPVFGDVWVWLMGGAVCAMFAAGYVPMIVLWFLNSTARRVMAANRAVQKIADQFNKLSAQLSFNDDEANRVSGQSAEALLSDVKARLALLNRVVAIGQRMISLQADVDVLRKEIDARRARVIAGLRAMGKSAPRQSQAPLAKLIMRDQQKLMSQPWFKRVRHPWAYGSARWRLSSLLKRAVLVAELEIVNAHSARLGFNPKTLSDTVGNELSSVRADILRHLTGRLLTPEKIRQLNENYYETQIIPAIGDARKRISKKVLKVFRRDFIDRILEKPDPDSNFPSIERLLSKFVKYKRLVHILGMHEGLATTEPRGAEPHYTWFLGQILPRPFDGPLAKAWALLKAAFEKSAGVLEPEFDSYFEKKLQSDRHPLLTKNEVEFLDFKTWKTLRTDADVRMLIAGEALEAYQDVIVATLIGFLFELDPNDPTHHLSLRAMGELKDPRTVPAMVLTSLQDNGLGDLTPENQAASEATQTLRWMFRDKGFEDEYRSFFAQQPVYLKIADAMKSKEPDPEIFDDFLSFTLSEPRSDQNNAAFIHALRALRTHFGLFKAEATLWRLAKGASSEPAARMEMFLEIYRDRLVFPVGSATNLRHYATDLKRFVDLSLRSNNPEFLLAASEQIARFLTHREWGSIADDIVKNAKLFAGTLLADPPEFLRRRGRLELKRSLMGVAGALKLMTDKTLGVSSRRMLAQVVAEELENLDPAIDVGENIDDILKAIPEREEAADTRYAALFALCEAMGPSVLRGASAQIDAETSRIAMAMVVTNALDERGPSPLAERLRAAVNAKLTKLEVWPQQQEKLHALLTKHRTEVSGVPVMWMSPGADPLKRIPVLGILMGTTSNKNGHEIVPRARTIRLYWSPRGSYIERAEIPISELESTAKRVHYNEDTASPLFPPDASGAPSVIHFPVFSSEPRLLQRGAEITALQRAVKTVLGAVVRFVDSGFKKYGALWEIMSQLEPLAASSWPALLNGLEADLKALPPEWANDWGRMNTLHKKLSDWFISNDLFIYMLDPVDTVADYARKLGVALIIDREEEARAVPVYLLEHLFDGSPKTVGCFMNFLFVIAVFPGQIKESFRKFSEPEKPLTGAVAMEIYRQLGVLFPGAAFFEAIIETVIIEEERHALDLGRFNGKGDPLEPFVARKLKSDSEFRNFLPTHLQGIAELSAHLTWGATGPHPLFLVGFWLYLIAAPPKTVSHPDYIWAARLGIFAVVWFFVESTMDFGVNSETMPSMFELEKVPDSQWKEWGDALKNLKAQEVEMRSGEKKWFTAEQLLRLAIGMVFQGHFDSEVDEPPFNEVTHQGNRLPRNPARKDAASVKKSEEIAGALTELLVESIHIGKTGVEGGVEKSTDVLPALSADEARDVGERISKRLQERGIVIAETVAWPVVVDAAVRREKVERVSALVKGKDYAMAFGRFDERAIRAILKSDILSHEKVLVAMIDQSDREFFEMQFRGKKKIEFISRPGGFIDGRRVQDVEGMAGLLLGRKKPVVIGIRDGVTYTLSGKGAMSIELIRLKGLMEAVPLRWENIRKLKVLVEAVNAAA